MNKLKEEIYQLAYSHRNSKGIIGGENGFLVRKKENKAIVFTKRAIEIGGRNEFKV